MPYRLSAMTTRPLLLAAVLAALVTAGCASPAGSPSAGSTPDPSFSAAPAPTASELPTPTKSGAGQQTVTGTVTAGVEPGCLLLDKYLLIFTDPALKAQATSGARVTVTGAAEPGLMTTCQQGTPFRVTAIRPA